MVLTGEYLICIVHLESEGIMTGEELRRIRHRLGLTQKQFAEQLGWHPNSVARAERNEMPIAEPVARLATLLLKLAPSRKRRR
jgi:transcriptional regulator with XRE-family HTH domain